MEGVKRLTSKDKDLTQLEPETPRECSWQEILTPQPHSGVAPILCEFQYWLYSISKIPTPEKSNELYLNYVTSL